MVALERTAAQAIGVRHPDRVATGAKAWENLL